VALVFLTPQNLSVAINRVLTRKFVLVIGSNYRRTSLPMVLSVASTCLPASPHLKTKISWNITTPPAVCMTMRMEAMRCSVTSVATNQHGLTLQESWFFSNTAVITQNRSSYPLLTHAY